MKPILFDKSATTFTTNGKGRLDPIQCEVVEERNGQFELTMTIAETAAHASEIEMDSIIVAKTCHGGSEQPFRVYKITKPINGRFVVYAQHISYQLSYIPTMPFTVAASASACNTTLQALKTNAAETCPFSFWTDVATVASYTQKTPASIRSRLGGVEGSVLDQFGGEYEWDGYTVKLHANRGKTTPDVTLRYGKNITDISQEEHISNTITGVCPFWAASDGSSVVTLPEKVVESQYASQYPFKRTVPLDCSENWENAPTQTELRTYAQAYVNKAGIGIPTVSIKVSFVDLSETEEYKDKVQLQTVKLCDRIKVEFEKLGISTTAKVVKVTYDVLAERYTEIEVGTIRTSLAHTISSTAGAIDTALGKAIFAAQSATAWLTSSNGYVHAVKNADGTWKELIFADTDDPSTWHNLLRINENGIGFSHDGGTTYSQAWTLDGKMVVGGTACPSLTVYDSNNHVLFQIDRDGLEWNSLTSQMAKTGQITSSWVYTQTGVYPKREEIIDIFKGVVTTKTNFYNSSDQIAQTVGSMLTQGNVQFFTGSENNIFGLVGGNFEEMVVRTADLNRGLFMFDGDAYEDPHVRLSGGGGANVTIDATGTNDQVEINGSSSNITLGNDAIYLNPGADGIYVESQPAQTGGFFDRDGNWILVQNGLIIDGLS